MNIKDFKILINYDIEKEFPIGENDRSVSDMEKTADRVKEVKTFDYFLQENTKILKDTIEKLESEEQIAITKYAAENKEIYCILDEQDFKYYKDDILLLTSGQKVELLEAVKAALEKKIARCRRWWKRYGVEKLNIWTYWTEA